MAKTTTRIYLLAKDLGVSSKAILDKCQAEGLEFKGGHMTPLTAGQAATIREWFTEGAHATTMETTGPVDLDKARVRKKKKVAADAPETDVQAIHDTAPVAETQESSTAETTKPQSPVIEASQGGQPAVAEATTSSPQAQAVQTTAAETPVEPPKSVKTPAFSVPEIYVPPKPENVKPAGPMHKPKPAKLSGPTVIRVESVEPEKLRPPRKGKPVREKPKEPVSGTLILGKTDPVPPVLPKGKKSTKEKGKKGTDTVFEEEAKSGKGGKRMRAKDKEERQARLAAASGESLRFRPVRRIEARSSDEAPLMERPGKAVIAEPITVKELASSLRVKIGDIIGRLMKQGVMATANQVLATEAAELIAMELGTELVVQKKQRLIERVHQQFQLREKTCLQKRAPVVTMLGHVDHGKTSLLDRIRQAEVAKGEAGGITQHIGAYQAEIHGKKITFLDTPGHEAFTSLRARGANMTDVVVLVVAVDDGVMPQTIEAIRHAKAANVQIIVALNKIDLPGVDLHRVYGQLAEHELTPTEWGGTTEIVKTSAVTGAGIENLLEHLDYIAELKDFKADPTIPATGWIIEAKMTQSRGAVASLLLQEGSFEKGDILLAGSACGRVRTIIDSHGQSIQKAGPSMPVEISGLDEVPQAGDRFYKLDDINQASQAANENKHLVREESLAKRSQITLDNLFSQIAAGNIKELNLIIKADVQGSVEVLTTYLSELSTPEVKVKILHAAVGGITEGDVLLAEASRAIVIGFNVVPDEHVRQLADGRGVDIRLYSIIYRITEDVRAAMVGLLDPEYQEKTIGRLVVRNTFKVSGLGTIAGCYVTSGMIAKNARLRLIRDNIVIRDKCSIESLKHFKDDVREVKTGFECGVKLAGFDDVKVDDTLEVYETIEVARTL